MESGMSASFFVFFIRFLAKYKTQSQTPFFLTMEHKTDPSSFREVFCVRVTFVLFTQLHTRTFNE